MPRAKGEQAKKARSHRGFHLSETDETVLPEVPETPVVEEAPVEAPVAEPVGLSREERKAQKQAEKEARKAEKLAAKEAKAAE